MKGLKHYKSLSEDLKNEIIIYESSYQDFEKVFDFSVKPDKLTREQKKVLEDFINFYQGEGIYNKGLTKSRYQKIREIIIERVNFLKEQKEIVDKTISLHEELEKLQKKDGIDSSIVKKLKEKASEKYDPKTKKYNHYLNDLIEEYRSNKIESVNKELASVKEQSDNIKKENNFGKVVSSVFGPIGNNIYNTWASVHNFNTRNIRKYKPLNLLVKGGLVLLYAAIVANLSLAGALSPFLVFAGMGSAIIFAGITIKHSLPFAKYPEEVKLKNNIGSLKENWFRFLKSRGKGVINVDEHFYEGIDFSKYDVAKKEEVSVDAEEAKKVEEKETTEDLKEEKDGISSLVSSSDKEVEEENEVEVPKLSDFSYEKKESLSEETKKSDSSLEETTESVVEESKGEVKKESDIIESAPKKVRRRRSAKTEVELNEVDSGIEVNSLNDVNIVLRKFQDKGISSVDDWYTLRNVRLFLGRNFSKTGDHNYLELRNMFDELAKKMPKDLREKIAIAKTFESIDVSNKRKSIVTQVKDETKKHHQKEFLRIIELIKNSSIDELVMEEVNDFFNHYNVSSEERRDIQALLKEKEEKTVDSIRRKG